jgi:hypothetical protein
MWINEEHINHYNDKIAIEMVKYIPHQTSIIPHHAWKHLPPLIEEENRIIKKKIIVLDDWNEAVVVEEFVRVSNVVFLYHKYIDH